MDDRQDRPPESTTGTRGWDELYDVPSLFEQLEDEGSVSVRSLLEDAAVDVPLGGFVYHDRGIRVPGFDATFVHQPAESGGKETFGLQVDAVGPRSAWATFDMTRSWDAYLLRTDDGELAALTWMCADEFRMDEAGSYASKQAAIGAGRFSFAVFCHTEDEFTEHADRLRETEAPAYLQDEAGNFFDPQSEEDFYIYVDSSPEAFRTDAGAPPYLGILELDLSIRV